MHLPGDAKEPNPLPTRAPYVCYRCAYGSRGTSSIFPHWERNFVGSNAGREDSFFFSYLKLPFAEKAREREFLLVWIPADIALDPEPVWDVTADAFVLKKTKTKNVLFCFVLKPPSRRKRESVRAWYIYIFLMRWNMARAWERVFFF